MARSNRQGQRIRNQWKDTLPLHYCWICGRDDCLIEVHHVERRSHAKHPDDWCNFFLACHDCHQGPLESMSHAEQLALKRLHDPDSYDLKQWHLLRFPDGRAPDRVTPIEVERFYRKYLKQRRAS